MENSVKNATPKTTPLVLIFAAVTVLCLTLRIFFINWDPWMPMGLVIFAIYVNWRLYKERRDGK